MKLVLIDGFLIGWLIYGNFLYYSPKNNCAAIPDTQFAAEFMSCILMLGYMMMFMYGLILLTLPCLYIYLRAQLNAHHNMQGRGEIHQAQVPAVLQSLTRVTYDPE